MPPDSAKFCFTADSVGVLACTAAAVVNPPWLANSLEWSITPIVGSSLTTIPNLPGSNNQFGVKYLKASLVGYNVRDSVMVKVFYPKYSTNHPGGITPNWYYYWCQIDSVPMGSPAQRQYGGGLCDSFPTIMGYLDWPDGAFYHICFTSCMFNYIDCAADTWRGLDCFAAECRHEYKHVTDFAAWWPNGYIQQNDLDQPPDPITGKLGDGIPDDREGPGHEFPLFDPLERDSDHDGETDWHELVNPVMCTWTKGRADSLDWSQ